MSRNWVIDKLALTITYDSNLEKARKLIKAIGQQLAADPEMGRTSWSRSRCRAWSSSATSAWRSA